MLKGREEELEDPRGWLVRVAQEQSSARRLSQFYSGLDRAQPDWRCVVASSNFQSWAVERDDHSGTRIVDMLSELRDDYNFSHFAALIKHYLSNRPFAKKSVRTVVSGRYELLRKLGAGGFGEVFLAWSWETNTLYALKMIKPELLGDADALDRFKKEAECWVRCAGHPNIVRAYFLDHVEGQFYITLEYIAASEGDPSLLRQIDTNPTDEQLLLWFGDVVDGLAFAYQSGVRAHRDIKPGNILVDENGLAKVSDFGLAGLSEQIIRDFPENERNFLLTQHGTVFGSLPYMAPEQFRDPKGCDERSDIYSLGMTFYQLASNGDLPMGDLSMQTHMWNRIRRFHEVELPKAIPSSLWPVILKCIAKNPADRYQTVGAVRADLEMIARKLGIQLREQKAQDLDYWGIGDRAVTLLRLGHYEQALAEFERCLSIFPWEGRSIFNKGVCLSKMGRYQEALDCYERLPDNAPALINSEYCHRQLGDTISAQKAALRATELTPLDATAWVTLAVAMHYHGDFLGVVQALKRAQELAPEDPTVYYNASLAWLKLGNNKAAKESLKQFLELSAPDDARRQFAVDQLSRNHLD